MNTARLRLNYFAEHPGPTIVDVAAMIDDAVMLDELDLVVGFNAAGLDRHANDRSGMPHGL